MQAEIEWNGALQFTMTAGGHKTVLDGDCQAGSTPMELLLGSLAACMAIDIVLILGRMRSNLKSVRARVEGVRAETPPRRFTVIKIHFELAGTDVKPANVERSIKLSRETYCSVFSTLRPDLQVETTYEVVSAG